jgi:HAD superfamily hydrolase (TIGR01484 family)
MFGHELPYVLSDCDGTISNSKLEVSEETRKSIIKYQHKSAYHFSFVSGRLGPCCKSLARELKVELPVVSCNGALISDLKTGEIFSADYLNQNLVCQIIDESVKAGIDPFVYTPTQMAGLVGNPRFLI